MPKPVQMSDFVVCRSCFLAEYSMTPTIHRLTIFLAKHLPSVSVFVILLISIPLVHHYHLVLATSGFPGLHWDASLFSTVIINVANGKGWTFDSYAAALVDSPDQQYDGHGFMSVLIHGVVLKARNWQQLEQQFVWCHTITYLLWLAVFLIGRQRCILRSLNAVVSAFIISYITMCLQGRPEHLAAAILLPPAFLWTAGRRELEFHVCWAITSGLLFCTSPALGLLSAMFTIVLLGVDAKKRGQWKTLGSIAVSGVLSLMVSILVLQSLHPFGAQKWLSATLHGSVVAPDLSPYFFDFGRTMFLGLSVAVPFWNLTALIAMALGVMSLAGQRAYLLAGVFVFFCVQCILRMADYGIVAIFPMLLAILQSDLSIYPALDWRRIGLAGTLTACLVASCFTLEKALAISGSANNREFLERKVTEVCGGNSVVAYHANYRPSLVNLRPPSLNYVGIIPQSSPDTGQDAFYGKLETVIGQPVQWFLYPQTYRGMPPQTVYLGSVCYKLSFHNWTNDRHQAVGLPLVGAKPGLHVAIYRRCLLQE